MKLDRTRVIAIANQKGGCGKTTTTANLSAALAEAGYLVCVVDNDEQRNTTTGLGLDLAAHQRDGGYTVLDAHLKDRPLTDIVVGFEDSDQPLRENLILAPAHRELGAVETVHKQEIENHLRSESACDLDGDDLRRNQRLRLKKSIDSLRGTADFVFIDCPPNLRYLMTSALIAADLYLVPCHPATFDLSGLGELRQTVGKVKKTHNENLTLLGAVLVGAPLRKGRIQNTLDREAYETLVSDMGADKVFETVMSPTVKLRESFAFGQTIFEYAPEDPVTEQYRHLAAETVRRCEKLSAKVEVKTSPASSQASSPAPQAETATSPLSASAETTNV